MTARTDKNGLNNTRIPNIFYTFAAAMCYSQLYFWLRC